MNASTEERRWAAIAAKKKSEKTMEQAIRALVRFVRAEAEWRASLKEAAKR